MLMIIGFVWIKEIYGQNCAIDRGNPFFCNLTDPIPNSFHKSYKAINNQIIILLHFICQETNVSSNCYKSIIIPIAMLFNALFIVTWLLYLILKNHQIKKNYKGICDSMNFDVKKRFCCCFTLKS